MTEEKQEIGYYNTSTKAIVPGFSELLHVMSVKAKDVDENGNYKSFMHFGSNRVEYTFNIGGQLRLDRERRGGERLWRRIYDQSELEGLLKKRGATIEKVDSPDGVFDIGETATA